MKIGFIYAGQGSQFSGMGMDLYQNEPVFSHVVDKVDVSGQIKMITYSGTLEELSKTENTQPCMVLFAIALTKTLESYGIVPEMVAGLSLGEYSALYAAGVFLDKQAVDLVRFRGQAMAGASIGTDCGMTAILGLSRELLIEACEKASSFGVVSISNYNCPSQLVIGGEKQAVIKASEYALELGAKRAIPLNVSGPFHTALMKTAGDALKIRLADEKLGEMKVPVVFNCTASELKDGQDIKELLEKQVQSSVYFEDSINYMIDCGVDTFIEIGGGKVLSGFVKKISKKVSVYSVDSCDTLKNVICKIKGE